MFIAVLAVCLAAFRSDVSMGIFLSVSLIPASIRTPTIAMGRRAEGRPMAPSDVILSFIMTVLATWVVAASSLIAFLVTCLPSGLLTQNVPFGLVVGSVTMLAWMVWLSMQFLKAAREKAVRDREIRYR